MLVFNDNGGNQVINKMYVAQETDGRWYVRQWDPGYHAYVQVGPAWLTRAAAREAMARYRLDVREMIDRREVCA